MPMSSFLARQSERMMTDIASLHDYLAVLTSCAWSAR
jgi:hypothetical protein